LSACRSGRGPRGWPPHAALGATRRPARRRRSVRPAPVHPLVLNRVGAEVADQHAELLVHPAPGSLSAAISSRRAEIEAAAPLHVFRSRAISFSSFKPRSLARSSILDATGPRRCAVRPSTSARQNRRGPVALGMRTAPSPCRPAYVPPCPQARRPKRGKHLYKP